MDRRSYIKTSALAALGASLGGFAFTDGDVIIGHGDYRYKVNLQWGTLDAAKYPVTDCHEMVEDTQGRLILLTNNTNNNILIYNKDGEAIDAWSLDYHGAHGLTLYNEGGTDYLYITDSEQGIVSKHTLDGKKILDIRTPFENELDIKGTFQPTETAVLESNGNIYVSDGYGSQHIFIYNQDGKLLDYFGGSGDAKDKFFNCHGVAIDSRSGRERILITAREKNQLKYFTPEGQYLSTIDLPGAFICRPVIKGDNVYLATIWSGNKSSNSGFVSILDKNNQLISAPGGILPQYKNGELQRMSQLYTIFKHPHDVCVDDDDNIYVPQWSAGQVYPIKLSRV